MKLAAVTHEGQRRLAVVLDEETLAVVPAALGSLEDVVRSGPEALAAIRAELDRAPRVALDPDLLDAPLRRFNRDILCTGWNYLDHFEESRGLRGPGQEVEDLPEHPTFFTKGPDTVIAPREDIAFDASLSSKWDYEAELALVIGRDGRSIPEERAFEHVFGFCAANDISQRDLQRAHGGQWLKGKSIDRTMPLGPWLTTLDEVPDPYDLRIQCELNGRLMQDASTGQMAFRIERLISELSHGMTLRSGDLLLTGTPSGIGNARDPQVFLADGDVVVTRVSGLGELRNRVAAGAASEPRDTLPGEDVDAQPTA